MYESVLVPHSSLKCNSKFRVCSKLEISSSANWKFRQTRNFQLGCRNFQFAELEISSLNSKFPVGMSKFPVCRQTGNFEFKVEISSSKQFGSRNFQFGSRNFQFGTRNFHFELEISSLTKSKFRVVGWLYSCSSVLVH